MSNDWVLLSYRIPREPSTPRIAVWRKLRDLGALQIGDGLVALPATDETLEQLGWVAARVEQADGEAMVWRADLARRADADELHRRLLDERSAEYRELRTEVDESTDVDRRTVQRWRRSLRRIDRRSHGTVTERDAARRAIESRAAALTAESDDPTSRTETERIR